MPVLLYSEVRQRLCTGAHTGDRHQRGDSAATGYHGLEAATDTLNITGTT
jgi:hypothetical protein